MCLAGVTNPQITTYVADIAHGGIYPSNMKLVLEADGKAMKGTEGLPVGGEEVIEEPGVLDGLLKENLVEAIILFRFGYQLCLLMFFLRGHTI